MKNVFASKTIWFNIITLVLAVIALPEFISVLPASVLPYLAVLNTIGNVILRFYTTQPVTF